MALDGDITRCHGVGHFGRTCTRRADCERYLAIDADQRREAQSGRRPVHRYAEMLCRSPNYPFFQPVDHP